MKETYVRKPSRPSMFPNVLLLSIHERYAVKIFDGSKTVELRRMKPKLLPGDLIIVYVTSPKKEIIGVLEVAKVLASPPNDLWKEVSSKSGITLNEFNSYFDNAPLGFAIFVRKYDCFINPVKLNDLREKWIGFKPPQGYKYLLKEEITLLASLTQYDILGFSDLKKYVQGELCLANRVFGE
jgi:predicted transcriptional regulator